MNPYAGIADHALWSKGVALAPPGQLDPMIGHHRIEPQHKVATMGSCFAQNIARRLPGLGLQHFVVEPIPPGMDEQQARDESYGSFSARYGNVYTVRQALQLFDRAFGHFHPADDVWEHEHGYVDAFRPTITPRPFSSAQEVRRSAKLHLEQVKRVFLESDWLVLTLGLTEAWLSKIDGAVYPLAPGVHGGAFSESAYAFVNFGIDEVLADLRALLAKARAVNDGLRVILTVSPVPLAATYEKRHVLLSSSCSKAVLRVAADTVERELKNVVYFPSYEIITTPQTHASLFEDDLRQVSARGVNHVMRVFAQHFTETRVPEPATSATVSGVASTEVLCDEDEIERVLARSGARRG